MSKNKKQRQESPEIIYYIRTKIQRGIESGFSTRSAEEILQDSKKEIKERGNN